MLNIFIIGPMPPAGGKNKPIKASLVSIFEGLPQEIDYRIKIPEELTGGYIPENVFYEMDVADLVIADITGRSPNVFYEIAMLQSMGTPMILVDFVKDTAEPIPFYLNHTNLLQIAKEDAQGLSAGLSDFIHRFLDSNEFTNYSASVISQYYSLPLVDISAVMGVAFGYYTNFIRPFLKRNTGAIAQKENEVSELIIIKPEDLASEDTCKTELSNLLVDPVEKKYKCPESTRGIVFCPFAKGDKAYDVPAALFTLKNSPRIKKLKKKLYELQNFNPELRAQAVSKYESRVIEKFFSYLEYLIQEDAAELNNTYRFVNLGELKA